MTSPHHFHCEAGLIRLHGSRGSRQLGLLATIAFMAVYLLIGTPWILFVFH